MIAPRHAAPERRVISMRRFVGDRSDPRPLDERGPGTSRTVVAIIVAADIAAAGVVVAIMARIIAS